MDEPRFVHVYNYFLENPTGIADAYRDTTGPALEQAKTIKDSLEELLGLPEWMKRMLKVLNELLTIV